MKTYEVIYKQDEDSRWRKTIVMAANEYVVDSHFSDVYEYDCHEVDDSVLDDGIVFEYLIRPIDDKEQTCLPTGRSQR